MSNPHGEPPVRRRLEAATPAGGWPHPWPNAIELARVLPTERWTLVGGLMVQAHALSHGIDAIRPTDDLDLLLHIEMVTGLPGQAITALESLGYQLREPQHRKGPAYRFERPRPEFGPRGLDRIDVMSPDHPGHRAATMRRAPMFEVPGGKQALDRTATFRIITDDGTVVGLQHPGRTRCADPQSRRASRRPKRGFQRAQCGGTSDLLSKAFCGQKGVQRSGAPVRTEAMTSLLGGGLKVFAATVVTARR